MTAEINMGNVLPMLRQAVAERGEGYRFLDHFILCAYQVGGRPGCLIGVLLSQQGADSDTLEEADELGSVGFVFGLEGLSEISDHREAASAPLWDNYTTLPGFEATDNAVRVMRAAQHVQDQGGTWGEAYAAAEDVHGLLSGQEATQ